jgi:uncharacterized protein (UPF0332 family)
VTDDNRRLAIAQEIRRGREARRAAESLRDLGLGNDALDRIYYALFHHVLALLLIEGIEPRRHAAIPGLLGQHVVGRHELTAADVAIISRAYATRDLADYERTWTADPITIADVFAEVTPLLDRIETYLRTAGWLDSPPSAG